jgi:pimeloyl-ACP methyl ester carboxylesterase
MQPVRVFVHGLESSGQGTKGVFFRERFPEMIIEDFAGSFRERMEKLEDLLAGKENLIIVGSSYGGLMAAAYASLNEERVRKLVLLAPALHLDPFKLYLTRKLSLPVALFHGLRDDVVPLEAVQAIAGQLYDNLTLTVLEDDHSLHDTFATLDWNALLSL